jgi:flagellar biosynthesis component FlhA
MTANASSGDDLTINIGLIILSTAFTVYRCRKYLGERMKDHIQTAIDVKPALMAAFGGGAITFTSGNIISLIGLCVAVSGAVIAFLQWRVNQSRHQELKRANDLAERRLKWEMEGGKVKGIDEKANQ